MVRPWFQSSMFLLRTVLPCALAPCRTLAASPPICASIEEPVAPLGPANSHHAELIKFKSLRHEFLSESWIIWILLQHVHLHLTWQVSLVDILFWHAAISPKSLLRHVLTFHLEELSGLVLFLKTLQDATELSDLLVLVKCVKCRTRVKWRKKHVQLSCGKLPIFSGRFKCQRTRTNSVGNSEFFATARPRLAIRWPHLPCSVSPATSWPVAAADSVELCQAEPKVSKDRMQRTWTCYTYYGTQHVTQHVRQKTSNCYRRSSKRRVWGSHMLSKAALVIRKSRQSQGGRHGTCVWNQLFASTDLV